MQLDSILILLITIVFGGVLSQHEHTRTKRLMYAMCPPGFVGIGSLCYYISDYQVSWLEAQFECKDKKSKLAEPVKVADRKLRRYLQENDKGQGDLWIGGTFDWQTEKWTWGYTGKEMTYNSFSHLNPGSSKDIHYHCAVLDHNVKYRWSPKSCVEKNRFVCQHKMPHVSEKNRVKVYHRWNETYPNQLANEVVLELTGDEDQRIPDNGQRRRRRPYHEPLIPSTTQQSPRTSGVFNNDVNIQFEAHEIKEPVAQFIPNPKYFPSNYHKNDNDVNGINYQMKPNRRRRPKITTTEIPINDANIEMRTTPNSGLLPFDIEIKEKRRIARERRKEERRKQRQQRKEEKQRQIEEEQKLKAIREAEQKRLQEEVNKKRIAQLQQQQEIQRQLQEQERERLQSEIDRKRVQELEEQKKLKAIEDENQKKEEEHRKIVAEREQRQKEHEEQLTNKNREHNEWRERERQAEEERQKLIQQQQEEYKRLEEERKAEEKRRMDEELARLEKERKNREEKQRARDEEIRRRQEEIQKQKEEEQRIQEELRQQQEADRQARLEEEKRKEEERKRLEEEETRKQIEREERQRQKQFKKQKAEQELKRLEDEKATEEKKRKQREFRERLAKLSPEQQYLFFKRREERNKRKRLAPNKSDNDVLIPE